MKLNLSVSVSAYNFSSEINIVKYSRKNAVFSLTNNIGLPAYFNSTLVPRILWNFFLCDSRIVENFVGLSLRSQMLCSQPKAPTLFIVYTWQYWFMPDVTTCPLKLNFSWNFGWNLPNLGENRVTYTLSLVSTEETGERERERHKWIVQFVA